MTIDLVILGDFLSNVGLVAELVAYVVTIINIIFLVHPNFKQSNKQAREFEDARVSSHPYVSHWHERAVQIYMVSMN